MREPFHQLHIHLIWATWDRLPILTKERKERVYACIQAECTALNVEVIALGGVADHVHVLVRIPPSVMISQLVKQIKGASSHLATHEITPDTFFKWQGGYIALAVSKSLVPTVRAYILSQETHHRDNTLDPDAELE